MELDNDGDGVLSKEELKSVFWRSGRPQLDSDHIDLIISHVNSNLEGSISYHEFLTAAVNRQTLLSEENLKSSFRMLDLESDGYITG